jgi:hypothetical protein
MALAPSLSNIRLERGVPGGGRNFQIISSCVSGCADSGDKSLLFNTTLNEVTTSSRREVRQGCAGKKASA